MKFWLFLAIAVTGWVVYANRPDGNIAHAMDMVKYSLKDPTSAEFRGIAECPANPGMMYGEVNAKNSLGAFTGYSRFYTFGGAAHVGPFWKTMEWEGRRYSLADQMDQACFQGGDPNPANFDLLVMNGRLRAVP